MTDDAAVLLAAFQSSAAIADLLARTQGHLAPRIVWDALSVSPILGAGGDLWSDFYDAEPLKAQRPVMLLGTADAAEADGHVPLAAGGMLVPRAVDAAASVASLTWLAAERADEAEAVLEVLETHAHAAGCARIACTRNAFGLGWPGVPALPVLDGAFRARGWTLETVWEVWAHPGPTPGRTAPIVPAGVHIGTPPPQGREFRITAQDTATRQTVGECTLWAVPDAAADAVAQAAADASPVVFTIEYIEVASAWRRRGIGRALLMAALAAAGPMLLWTEPGNAAMRGLATACGFTHAFSAHAWAKTLNR